MYFPKKVLSYQLSIFFILFSLFTSDAMYKGLIQRPESEHNLNSSK